MKGQKEKQNKKDFLEQKIREIKEKFDLQEMIELGVGEGIVLDVGDHVGGIYCGIQNVSFEGGRERVILLQTEDHGLVSLRNSVALGQHLINIKDGTFIVILCYDSESVADDPDRTYKKFKVYGKRLSK